MKLLQETTNLKGKSLFMPLRAALTANLHGPELPKIMELLGSDKVKQRLIFAETLILPSTGSNTGPSISASIDPSADATKTSD